MPWNCKRCGAADLNDTVPGCPECHQAKTAWTLVVDQTRTLTISRKSFVLERGDGSSSAPAAATPVALSAATSITVLPTSELLAIAERGHVPPSAQVVFVTLHPRRSTDLTVELTPVYAGQPAQPLSFTDVALPGSEGVYHAPFVFTFGSDSLEGLTFPDLTIVDITEGDGFAPSVEFRALNKRAQELPVSATKLRRFAFSI